MKSKRRIIKREPKVVMHGELLVTGYGELLIERPLQRSRALFVRSTDAIKVTWEGEPSRPSPNAVHPDELTWEIFTWNSLKCDPVHGRVHNDGELFLMIKWYVNAARSIRWQVFEIN